MLFPRKLVLALCVGLWTAGCAYTAPLTNRTAPVMSPMVSKPLQTPLFLVMDPATVMNDFQVRNTPHSVKGFRPYLFNSVKKAMSPFFANIEIVQPGFSPPEGPHYTASIKAEQVAAINHRAGQMVYSVLKLSWSMGLRTSGSGEFVFSFAGEGKSELSYPRLEVGVDQMTGSALNGLLQVWGDKGVFSKLKQLEQQPEPQPAKGPTTI